MAERRRGQAPDAAGLRPLARSAEVVIGSAPGYAPPSAAKNTSSWCWRHEDLFFAALGGAYPGGEPVTTSAELAANGASRPRPVPPASPFSHGTAHWMALATLFQGGTVVVVIEQRRCDPDRRLGHRRGRGGHDARDRGRRVRPAVGRRARPSTRPVGPRAACSSWSPAARRSPRRSAQELLRAAAGDGLVDGYGTSETGGQGQMPVWPGQPDGGLPRFHVDADTAVLDDAGRPAAPGSG